MHSKGGEEAAPPPALIYARNLGIYKGERRREVQMIRSKLDYDAIMLMAK